MAFCPNCGKSVDNGVNFCPSCGAAIPTNNEFNGTPLNEEFIYDAPQPKQRELNVAQLVWSIINVVLCCMPLGIAAVVFTIMAKDAPDDETEAKRLKNALIFNIISTVAGVLVTIISFIVSFALGFMGALM
ncbi:MAG: CD225/dispanin family protein [Clostridia bacterium]|nr:CD225/dispanin family protein [Clostridia bacterium]